MTWTDWNAFWAMGGYAGFVWGAYGVATVLLAGEIVALRLRRRRACLRAERSAAAASGGPAPRR
jgi:heme exporter protein CcmD